MTKVYSEQKNKKDSIYFKILVKARGLYEAEKIWQMRGKPETLPTQKEARILNKLFDGWLY